ncbi:MAG: site-specific integrase [Candidatus Palauibacterales bacterium]|nr:site-specific integrase [Candidatus Palauibacterales bacterium]
MSRRKAGQGYVFKPKYKDKKTGKQKESATWWCGYSIRSEKYRESTGHTSHKAAVDFLNERLRQIGKNKPSPKEIEAITFEDLMEAIRGHYTRNRLKGKRRLESAIGVLSRSFEGWAAVDITDDAIEAFQTRRLDQGRAPATVNWDVSTLRRAFRLFKKRGLTVPDVKSLVENNVRQGFVTEKELQRLLTELPLVHRGWTEFCFVTGWRVDSEALSRTWAHVDQENGFIFLNPNETKNAKPRRFPLIERVRHILDKQWERKEQIERQRQIIVPWVFMLDHGGPIKYPEKSWKRATKAAGLEGLLRHDLRRAAIMNMERAGLPRSTSMALSGHLSASIYNRYCIQSEQMLKEGGARLQALHDATPDRKVIPLTR